MRVFRSLLFIGTFVIFTASVFADGVIIRCDRPCTAAKAAVAQAGGSVTHEYKYVGAIAAEVDRSGAATISRSLPAGSVRKDVIYEIPTVALDRDGNPLALEASVDAEAAALGQADIEALASANPDGYSINNSFINVAPLHAAGLTGNNVRVAVIDSGLRPSWVQLFGNVLGGEDFVNDGRPYIHSTNGTHGTFVSGMIANNVLLNLASHSWRPPIQYNCPSCVSPTGGVAMVGSAPGAKLYALRVFGPTGGAPESRIIAAMERVIELKENYDAGVPETANPNGSYNALDIGVCNMSLGGVTFHAGRDIEDELTRAFLDHDIVLVTSAGNNGPSGSTGGSPGTGFASLTVGAASTATHERIVRDIQYSAIYGLGVGTIFRPFAGTQTAPFSSRGPTADGRTDPEVTANGFFSFSSTQAGSLSISSGTSFSAPTVSGVAAVLRQSFPIATARQIRNAIILGADPNALGDESGSNDQGYGFVDALASAALLAGGAVPDTDGAIGGSHEQVQVNLTQGGGVDIQSGNVTRSATLLPGQRLEVYYSVKKNTAAVVVTVDPVQPGAAQNLFFGDDVILAVHSAKTSSIGSTGDYPVTAYTTGGSWAIESPDSGLMRITLVGSPNNASPIGATVRISSTSSSTPGNLSHGRIDEGDLFAVPFKVPAGAGALQAVLEWDNHWGAYPTADLDLILVSPSGGVNTLGATIDSPERVGIATPEAGTWTAYVQGFTVPSVRENYNLQILVDGKPAKN